MNKFVGFLSMLLVAAVFIAGFVLYAGHFIGWHPASVLAVVVLGLVALTVLCGAPVAAVWFFFVYLPRHQRQQQQGQGGRQGQQGQQQRQGRRHMP